MDVIYNSFSDNADDWFDLMTAFIDIEGQVLIEGTLDLWTGKHTIQPVECDSLMEAINKCIGKDCEDLQIYREGDKYLVKVYHHDGTNEFTIKFI